MLGGYLHVGAARAHQLPLAPPVVAGDTESRVLGEAVMAGYAGPGDVEPPQAAWHREIRATAAPLAAEARAAGAIRGDLGENDLLALTTVVARAGSPAQANQFLDVLLEGVVPPCGQHGQRRLVSITADLAVPTSNRAYDHAWMFYDE
ncbi:hypothetical protein ABIA39_006133 [Nocardia sp. GAS34]|uniref:SbtR family transcriptional regulator n=1 Tax=unclassified Nocardia TaxID=2637762 RepID=UPI003D1D394C